MVENGNGRKSILASIQTVLLIVTMAFLFIDKFIIGERTTAILSERVAKLEGLVQSLGSLPASVTDIRVAVSSLQALAESNRNTLTRVEINLQDHMKGK